jgi:hypothetical protein
MMSGRRSCSSWVILSFRSSFWRLRRCSGDLVGEAVGLHLLDPAVERAVRRAQAGELGVDLEMVAAVLHARP